MENKNALRSFPSIYFILLDFARGRGYPLLSAALVLLGHFFGLEVLATSILLVSSSLLLLISDSIRPMLTLLVSLPYVISVKHGPGVPSFSDHLFSSFRPYVIMAAFLVFVISFTVFLMRKRIACSFDVLNIPGIIPLSVFCLSLVAGGLFSELYTTADTFFGFLEACSFFLPYVLIFISLKISRDSEILNYFVFLIAVSASVLVVQVVALFGSLLTPVKENMLFGWGTWTHAGSAIATRIPILFLGYRRLRRKWCYLALAVLSLTAVFLTMSRGAIAIGVLVFIISAFIVVPKKRLAGLLSLILTGVLISAMLLLSRGVVGRLLAYFLNDNGRFDIWRRGIEYFSSSPIFGVGYASVDYGSFTALIGMPDMAHNTFVQLLASTGLFGVASYIIYRASTLRIIFGARSRDRALVLLSVLALLIGSLADNFIFYVTPLFSYSALLAISAAESVQKND